MTGILTTLPVEKLAGHLTVGAASAEKPTTQAGPLFASSS